MKLYVNNIVVLLLLFLSFIGYRLVVIDINKHDTY